MKNLEQLQEAKHLNDLAKLLSFKFSAMIYFIYKMNDSEKYKKFEIPKKSSLEKRVIHAPNVKLSLLKIDAYCKLLRFRWENLEKFHEILQKSIEHPYELQ